MKRCATCKRNKPLNDFTWRSKAKERKNSHCGSCRKEYAKIWYQKNPNRRKSIKEATKRIKIKRQQYLSDYKCTKGCKDCGIKNPIVLDFDHLRDKSFTISAKLLNSWNSILEEIQKCDVVCSNCHRIRTHNRRASVA